MRAMAHAVHAHALDARRGREGPARHQERKAPGVAARLRRLAGLVVRCHEGQAGGVGHGDVDARQTLVEVELEGGDHAEGGRKVLEPLGERQARRPLAVLLAGGEGTVLWRGEGREARKAAEEGLDALLAAGPVRAGPLCEVGGKVEGALQGDEAVVAFLGELVHVARHPPAAVAAQAVCGEAGRALPVHEAASCEKCRQHAVVGRGLPVGDQVAQGGGHVVAPLDQGLDAAHAGLGGGLRCGIPRAFWRGRRLFGRLRGDLELLAVAQGPCADHGDSGAPDAPCHGGGEASTGLRGPQEGTAQRYGGHAAHDYGPRRPVACHVVARVLLHVSPPQASCGLDSSLPLPARAIGDGVKGMERYGEKRRCIQTPPEKCDFKQKDVRLSV